MSLLISFVYCLFRHEKSSVRHDSVSISVASVKLILAKIIKCKGKSTKQPNTLQNLMRNC